MTKRARGKLDEARVLFEKALEHARKELALRDPDPEFPPLNEAVIEDNFGHVFLELGQLARARDHCENAAKSAVAILGPHHPEMGKFYNTLGRVLMAQGDARAAVLFAMYVDVARRDRPVKKEELAEALHNLAATFLASESTRARELLEEALALEEEIKHEPALPATLHHLALAYLGEGNLAAARKAWTRALPLAERYAPGAKVTSEIENGLAELPE